MKRDNTIFLKHIVESIEFIEKYTENISLSDFINDIEKQDSVIRRLEIIGEASKKLETDFKQSHLDIPWQKIAGTRDILIHEYFGTDIDLIWEIVKENLPELKMQLKKLIR